MRRMILALFTLFSSASFAITQYSELTTLLANHPEAKVEDVLAALDPSLYENHVLVYHPGGLLTGTPALPAVAVSTQVGGTTEVAEQKSLMTVIFQTNEGQGRAQEIEVLEWDAPTKQIHFHRIAFDPATRRLQRIENDPSRCIVCHGFSNDGDRNRPIWDSYSRNPYSGNWGSFPDIVGGGLSFDNRVFESLKNSSALPSRMRNVPLRMMDTTPGFATTLFAMNWVSFTNDTAQKISALSSSQAQSLKADFDRYFGNADGISVLETDPGYQNFLKDVTNRRKTYLREKFGRAIVLEGMFANSAEKDSVRSISDATAFANADHAAYFSGNADDLTLARQMYVLRKNGVALSTSSMTLTSEVYTTRSVGMDEHIAYFTRKIGAQIRGL